MVGNWNEELNVAVLAATCAETGWEQRPAFSFVVIVDGKSIPRQKAQVYHVDSVHFPIATIRHLGVFSLSHARPSQARCPQLAEKSHAVVLFNWNNPLRR